MALGLLAKLIMTKQLRFEDGQVELKDVNITLVPSFFISELTRYFYDAKKMPRLYLLSWIWSHKFCGEVSRQFNLDTPSKVYNFGMELLEAMGIGLYKTYDYYPQRYTHFSISNNPYLQYLSDIKSSEPIDYFISGLMAGGGCFVHGQLTQNVELKCKACGDEICDFLTGTEQELKNRGLWEIAVKRYNLEEIYPTQKEFYEAFQKKQDSEVMEDIIEKTLKI